VIFGIDEPEEYKGGYYFGKVVCPDNYPAKSPTITLLTENGRFTR